VCGIWGTLAVGLFSNNPDHSFLTQLIGVAVCGLAAFSTAFLIFFIMKKTIGIRVSKQHETDGLDSHEHGIRGFTITYE
jgi:Amt family ammonium transporter